MLGRPDNRVPFQKFKFRKFSCMLNSRERGRGPESFKAAFSNVEKGKEKFVDGAAK
jgi:hypothetical protein